MARHKALALSKFRGTDSRVAWCVGQGTGSECESRDEPARYSRGRAVKVLI